MPFDPRAADALHSNSIDVLTEQTAPFIPGAKPGNVLLSLRNLDMLIVMDLDTETIVWTLRGSWRKQHDAKMLSNGHILLFDNEGGLTTGGRSRVLEINPKTAGIVWSYNGTDDDPLDSGDNRGGAERLTGGNLLINELTPAHTRGYSGRFGRMGVCEIQSKLSSTVAHSLHHLV